MLDTKQYRFRGVASPNTTQVPDQYFDELLSVCSGAEFKVLMYITRRTMGFKRPSDNISLSQLLHGITTRDGRVLDRGTGLSKPTLLKALRSLTDMGPIVPDRRSSLENGDEPTCYSLRFADAANGAPAPVVKKIDQGGGQNSLPGAWSRKLTTQQTGEQETGKQQTVSSKFHISNGTNKQTATDAIVENVPELAAPTKRQGRSYPRRSERIEVVIEELSADLDDSEHCRANCTQALRLFERSGLSDNAFESRLYEARSITRDEMNHRRLTGVGAPLQNCMAYFFAVLRHELDRGDPHAAAYGKEGGL